jgi:superfamily II DNA/RNA helicase
LCPAAAAAINFMTPTRIQQAVIPLLLAGRDVLASAPTGSGKTLSFVAPIAHYIQVSCQCFLQLFL